MADKILRQENDQFIHKELVDFTEHVGIGISLSNIDEILSGDIPFTLTVEGTDAIAIPMGTTAQRPDIVNIGNLPLFRYNSEASKFELFNSNLDIWEYIGDSSSLSALSAQVQSNTNRIAALEYVDINITALTVPQGTVFEFDAPAVAYTLTFSWVINKVPTTNELLSQSYGTETLTNTATGTLTDDYQITNTSGAELSRWWRCSATSVAGAEHSSDTYTRNVYWVYPYYYGTSSNDYSAGGVDALTKSISRRSTKIVDMDATNEFLYFSYPASYSDLTSIKDGNGFEVIGSFTQHIANVTGASGVAISYKIYKTNSVTTIDQNFTFTY